jgi:lipopolysaccharide export LptBFGC system permease protein LptF
MSSSQMDILSNQFNSLISQYQNTYKDFINTIGVTDASFITINDTSYVTGNNINTIQNSSLDNCVTSCSSTQSCSGATFDNQQNTCILSSGTGNIVNSSNQTSIVKQALFYSYQLQLINNQLSQINNSMMSLTNNNASDFQENQQSVQQKSQILQQNYNSLEQERGQIEDIIRQYETLNSAQENGVINITSNYYRYIVYFIIALLLIFLLIKFSSSTEQRGGGHLKIPPYIFLILALIILFNAFLKNNY